jgi:hypothetical protein
MKVLRSSLFLLFLPLLGCGVESNTSCADPTSSDPACLLDENHLPGGIGEGSAEAGVPSCTAEREGRIYYVALSQSFKLCSSGQNIDINLQGPAGPAGPAGSSGTGVGAQTLSARVEPGSSLNLSHNLNTLTPAASAYFVRNSLMRPVSDYQRAVGRKSITVTGAGRDTNFKPQVLSLTNGQIGVIHGYLPDNLTSAVVLDIYSDEGELVKLNAKVFPQLSTIRAIAVSNGIFIVYEAFGSNDEYFTIVDNSGAEVIPPTLIGSSPGTNRIKDLKKLSNGNIVLAEKTAANFASFRIFDPLRGTVVASNLTVAPSTDTRTFTAPLNGKFQLYFTDTNAAPYAKVAVFNNDGTLSAATMSAGVGNETIFGSEAVAADRVAVVTASFNNMSTTLFDGELNQVRVKTVYAPQSGDSSSPVALGNGNWVVCSARSEGFCVTYDREGTEIYRNGELFQSSSLADFSAISALGNQGRFALVSYNDAQSAGVINFLQGGMGRLDLEIVDANTVRVVNRSVEALPIVIYVSR